ncbi:hypothetical protein A3I56_01070 [Candidatus Roizmanbacteria bacterium RIFCSPLOWO2_02_FULL_43_10]|uniref:EamA domain-containing protein n=2 Tax=Candidatus Roizmaniibacteriota TaxID=1752723 RepID=A0A1F7JW39_9BACT|nr:MAG: hypothetical protein A3D08_01615 [Candidatus Roizmanbacteria bacterium RIFCSPHIGHO2_02_FULL_43_11]OGK59823.1 MAG: hypothetical protein A3I56_01070 [Candidatus Roizmanbacteria bacterium RIFCSPLOWO2_02_FULL_43_10]
MEWIFFSLVSSATYACVIFLDKYLLEAEVRDYNAMPIYMGIVAAIFAALLLLVSGFPVVPFRDAYLITTTGIIIAYAGLFYFKATSSEEASHINILIQSVPVMTLLLAFIFLNERILPVQYVGFMLILGAALGISYRKEEHILLSPALFLMMTYCFLWAVSSVLMKFLIQEYRFLDVLTFESLGITIGSLILYIGVPATRRAFHTTQRHLSAKARLIIGVNESLSILAKVMMFYAFLLGPVALVSVLTEGTQAFFALAYGLILTLALPKFFHEDISPYGLIKKSAFATTAFIGIWLLV